MNHGRVKHHHPTIQRKKTEYMVAGSSSPTGESSIECQANATANFDKGITDKKEW